MGFSLAGFKLPGSQRSLGGTGPKDSTRKEIAESQCEATVIDADDVDLELQGSSNENQFQPGKEGQPDSSSDDESGGDVLEFDFDDCNQKVRVPLPGETRDAADEGTSTRRLVPSGCAICLSLFDAGESITWSSNPQCTHIFHRECVLHWYLAVGRKAQRRRHHSNPAISDVEAPSKICDFSLACPCCRQDFCMSISEEGSMDIDGDIESQVVQGAGAGFAADEATSEEIAASTAHSG
jgi:Ring finger domain